MSRKRSLTPGRRRFQVGEIVRNAATKETGKVVRVYSDLLPAEGKNEVMAYIVALPDREVLWRDEDIDVPDQSSAAGESAPGKR